MNDYILEITDDPKDRIFDKKKQENYLDIVCEYTYKVSSDLGKDLDRKNLYETLMSIL